MSGLFGSTPKPQAPAPMPDPNDEAAQRKKRESAQQLMASSSIAQDKLAPVPGTIGREYTRQKLGAN